MIEVEVKFRLDNENLGLVTKWLTDNGVLEKPEIYQIDEVFLVNSDSFKGFKRGDPVVRLRTVNDLTTLAYKRSINDRGDSIEHEIECSPLSAAEEMLREMGYKRVTCIKKKRKTYVLQDITIVRDEVEGLGSFLEIEKLCESGGEGVARERVVSMAESMGLKQADIETKKYDQLMDDRTRGRGYDS